MLRTPQNQGQTRLMPTSVNNFSTQNNMYHRSLMNQNQPQPGVMGPSGSLGQVRHSVDTLSQNLGNQNQMLIAQQNIKNIQSNMGQRSNA